MPRLPGNKLKTRGQELPTTNSMQFQAEWIKWGFGGVCVCVLGAMVVWQMPGAIIPALGTGLAFTLTRSGLTERLRPYHPAYCVGTSMMIWVLWSVAASGDSSLLVVLGPLWLGLGFGSLLPGLISATVLSFILVSCAAFAWAQRGEFTPFEREIIKVEVILLLLTVAATWAGYVESELQHVRPQTRRKKSSGQASRKAKETEEDSEE